jgi:hypothetical protein
MKKIVFAFVLLAALLSGCARNLTTQEQLQMLVRDAVVVSEFAKVEALEECGAVDKCEKAEDLQQWIDLGNQLIAYLDKPVPEDRWQMIADILDSVIAHMEASEADPQVQMYARIIQNHLAAAH